MPKIVLNQKQMRIIREFVRGKSFGEQVNYLRNFRDELVPEGKLSNPQIAGILNRTKSTIERAVNVALFSST